MAWSIEFNQSDSITFANFAPANPPARSEPSHSFLLPTGTRIADIGQAPVNNPATARDAGQATMGIVPGNYYWELQVTGSVGNNNIFEAGLRPYRARIDNNRDVIYYGTDDIVEINDIISRAADPTSQTLASISTITSSSPDTNTFVNWTPQINDFAAIYRVMWEKRGFGSGLSAVNSRFTVEVVRGDGTTVMGTAELTNSTEVFPWIANTSGVGDDLTVRFNANPTTVPDGFTALGNARLAALGTSLPNITRAQLSRTTVNNDTLTLTFSQAPDPAVVAADLTFLGTDAPSMAIADSDISNGGTTSVTIDLTGNLPTGTFQVTYARGSSTAPVNVGGFVDANGVFADPGGARNCRIESAAIGNPGTITFGDEGTAWAFWDAWRRGFSASVTNGGTATSTSSAGNQRALGIPDATGTSDPNFFFPVNPLVGSVLTYTPGSATLSLTNFSRIVLSNLPGVITTISTGTVSEPCTPRVAAPDGWGLTTDGINAANAGTTADFMSGVVNDNPAGSFKWLLADDYSTTGQQTVANGRFWHTVLTSVNNRFLVGMTPSGSLPVGGITAQHPAIFAQIRDANTIRIGTGAGTPGVSSSYSAMGADSGYNQFREVRTNLYVALATTTGGNDTADATAIINLFNGLTISSTDRVIFEMLSGTDVLSRAVLADVGTNAASILSGSLFQIDATVVSLSGPNVGTGTNFGTGMGAFGIATYDSVRITVGGSDATTVDLPLPVPAQAGSVIGMGYDDGEMIVTYQQSATSTVNNIFCGDITTGTYIPAWNSGGTEAGQPQDNTFVFVPNPAANRIPMGYSSLEDGTAGTGAACARWRWRNVQNGGARVGTISNNGLRVSQGPTQGPPFYTSTAAPNANGSGTIPTSASYFELTITNGMNGVTGIAGVARRGTINHSNYPANTVGFFSPEEGNGLRTADGSMTLSTSSDPTGGTLGMLTVGNEASVIYQNVCYGPFTIPGTGDVIPFAANGAGANRSGNTAVFDLNPNANAPVGFTNLEGDAGTTDPGACFDWTLNLTTGAVTITSMLPGVADGTGGFQIVSRSTTVTIANSALTFDADNNRWTATLSAADRQSLTASSNTRTGNTGIAQAGMFTIGGTASTAASNLGNPDTFVAGPTTNWHIQPVRAYGGNTTYVTPRLGDAGSDNTISNGGLAAQTIAQSIISTGGDHEAIPSGKFTWEITKTAQAGAQTGRGAAGIVRQNAHTNTTLTSASGNPPELYSAGFGGSPNTITVCAEACNGELLRSTTPSSANNRVWGGSGSTGVEVGDVFRFELETDVLPNLLTITRTNRAFNPVVQTIPLFGRGWLPWISPDQSVLTFNPSPTNLRTGFATLESATASNALVPVVQGTTPTGATSAGLQQATTITFPRFTYATGTQQGGVIFYGNATNPVSVVHGQLLVNPPRGADFTVNNGQTVTVGNTTLQWTAPTATADGSLVVTFLDANATLGDWEFRLWGWDSYEINAADFSQVTTTGTPRPDFADLMNASVTHTLTNTGMASDTGITRFTAQNPSPRTSGLGRFGPVNYSLAGAGADAFGQWLSTAGGARFWGFYLATNAAPGFITADAHQGFTGGDSATLTWAYNATSNSFIANRSYGTNTSGATLTSLPGGDQNQFLFALRDTGLDVNGIRGSNIYRVATPTAAVISNNNTTLTVTFDSHVLPDSTVTGGLFFTRLVGSAFGANNIVFNDQPTRSGNTLVFTNVAGITGNFDLNYYRRADFAPGTGGYGGTNDAWIPDTDTRNGNVRNDAANTVTLTTTGYDNRADTVIEAARFAQNDDTPNRRIIVTLNNAITGINLNEFSGIPAGAGARIGTTTANRVEILLDTPWTALTGNFNLTFTPTGGSATSTMTTGYRNLWVATAGANNTITMRNANEANSLAAAVGNIALVGYESDRTTIGTGNFGVSMPYTGGVTVNGNVATSNNTSVRFDFNNMYPCYILSLFTQVEGMASVEVPVDGPDDGNMDDGIGNPVPPRPAPTIPFPPGTSAGTPALPAFDFPATVNEETMVNVPVMVATHSAVPPLAISSYVVTATGPNSLTDISALGLTFTTPSLVEIFNQVGWTNLERIGFGDAEIGGQQLSDAEQAFTAITGQTYPGMGFGLTPIADGIEVIYGGVSLVALGATQIREGAPGGLADARVIQFVDADNNPIDGIRDITGDRLIVSAVGGGFAGTVPRSANIIGDWSVTVTATDSAGQTSAHTEMFTVALTNERISTAVLSNNNETLTLTFGAPVTGVNAANVLSFTSDNTPLPVAVPAAAISGSGTTWTVDLSHSSITRLAGDNFGVVYNDGTESFTAVMTTGWTPLWNLRSIAVGRQVLQTYSEVAYTFENAQQANGFATWLESQLLTGGAVSTEMTVGGARSSVGFGGTGSNIANFLQVENVTGAVVNVRVSITLGLSSFVELTPGIVTNAFNATNGYRSFGQNIDVPFGGTATGTPAASTSISSAVFMGGTGDNAIVVTFAANPSALADRTESYRIDGVTVIGVTGSGTSRTLIVSGAQDNVMINTDFAGSVTTTGFTRQTGWIVDSIAGVDSNLAFTFRYAEDVNPFLLFMADLDQNADGSVPNFTATIGFADGNAILTGSTGYTVNGRTVTFNNTLGGANTTGGMITSIIFSGNTAVPRNNLVTLGAQAATTTITSADFNFTTNDLLVTFADAVPVAGTVATAANGVTISNTGIGTANTQRTAVVAGATGNISVTFSATLALNIPLTAAAFTTGNFEVADDTGVLRIQRVLSDKIKFSGAYADYLLGTLAGTSGQASLSFMSGVNLVLRHAGNATRMYDAVNNRITITPDAGVVLDITNNAIGGPARVDMAADSNSGLFMNANMPIRSAVLNNNTLTITSNFVRGSDRFDFTAAAFPTVNNAAFTLSDGSVTSVDTTEANRIVLTVSGVSAGDTVAMHGTDAFTITTAQPGWTINSIDRTDDVGTVNAMGVLSRVAPAMGTTSRGFTFSTEAAAAAFADFVGPAVLGDPNELINDITWNGNNGRWNLEYDAGQTPTTEVIRNGANVTVIVTGVTGEYFRSGTLPEDIDSITLEDILFEEGLARNSVLFGSNTPRARIEPMDPVVWDIDFNTGVATLVGLPANTDLNPGRMFIHTAVTTRPIIGTPVAGEDIILLTDATVMGNTVTLTQSQLDMIHADGGAANNTWFTYYRGGQASMATIPVLPRSFTEDTTAPRLVEWNIDLRARTMQLVFNEAVDPCTLRISDLRIDATMDGTGSNHVLTTSAVVTTVPSRVVDISLSRDDFNAIRTITAANAQTLFFSAAQGYIRDLNAAGAEAVTRRSAQTFINILLQGGPGTGFGVSRSVRGNPHAFTAPGQHSHQNPHNDPVRRRR